MMTPFFLTASKLPAYVHLGRWGGAAKAPPMAAAAAALREDEAAARAVVESMGELQILRAVHELQYTGLVVVDGTTGAGLWTTR